jgi:hypothetical protein
MRGSSKRGDNTSGTLLLLCRSYGGGPGLSGIRRDRVPRDTGFICHLSPHRAFILVYFTFRRILRKVCTSTLPLPSLLKPSQPVARVSRPSLADHPC